MKITMKIIEIFLYFFQKQFYNLPINQGKTMQEIISQQEVKKLEKVAYKIRMYNMYCIANLGIGHIGGSLSLIEILTYLYWKEIKVDPKNPNWDERDIFILSKGHAGPALYSTLALKGFFPESWLNTLNKGGTRLPSHCDRNQTPGIDMSTGSLGQGLSVACGVAYGAKLKKKNRRVYSIIGDGETEEGQNWEAAMFASQKKLDNLIALTDYNKMQLDGTTAEIVELENLVDKWRAFGWQVEKTNGHDFSCIDKAFKACHNTNGKPKMIILDTIKAKGLPRLENKVESHNSSLSIEEVKQLYNGEVPSWIEK